MNNTNTAIGTGLWLKTAENMFDKWSSISKEEDRSSETSHSTVAIARQLSILEREAEQSLTFSQALRLTHQLDDDVKTLEKQFGTEL